MKRLAGTLEEREAARFLLRAGTKLRPYQRPIVARAIGRKSFGYLMDPRLGKTLCSIAVTGYQFRKRLIYRWLIVAPKIAKHVWMDEIQKRSAMRVKVAVIQGAKDDKAAQVQLMRVPRVGHLSVLVTNPEQIWRIRRILLRWIKGEGTAGRDKHAKVTIDESHRIKHRGSRQARMAHSLGYKAEYREILTGTLFNSPLDVFSQFKFLEPDLFGTDWKEFCEHYVKSYGYGGYKPRTFKNLEDLWEKVGSISYSLTRADAGGFPKEQFQAIRFDLTGKSKTHYREMQEDYWTQVGEGHAEARIVLTQALRLQQITGGFLSVRHPDDNQAVATQIGDDKLRALVELMNDYPTKEPVIVFARFKYELASIEAALKKLGRRVDVIAGGRDNEAVRREFQAGKLDSVVVQIRSAISISLARAQTAIYYSPTSSLIDYDQSRARIAEQGPENIAFVHLVAVGTVDEDQYAALQERQDFVAAFRSAIARKPALTP